MSGDNFCLYLNHQTRINLGQIEPCCWFKLKTDAYDAVKVKEYNARILEIDGWVDECNHCWHLESNNAPSSPRLLAFKDPSLLGITETTGPRDITSLEIQVDTECNAACIQCGPHNSTTWKKYQSTNIIKKSEFNKKINLNNKLSTEQHIEMIKQSVDFSKLNQVAFLGGEPLINDTHIQLIKEIAKYKSLDTLSLRYNTNGSQPLTDELTELWRQVKQINLLISIDGIDEHFNYHRWPLQWHQVEKNIEFFRDADLPNLKLGISSTVTPFNIFYYDRYLQWQEDFFKNNKSKLRGGFAYPHVAQGNQVNMYSIPPRLSEQIKVKYKDFPWLVSKMEPFDLDQYKNFIKYIDFHDQKRSINWKEVFPEIVEYFV